MTETTNYKLRKPADNDNYSVGDANFNADVIDTQLKAREDVTNTLSQTVATQATQISALDTAKANINHTHTPESIGAATAAQGARADNAMPISGGTFTGVAVAQNNTSYTTKQLRNIVMHTSTGIATSHGDVLHVYE